MLRSYCTFLPATPKCASMELTCVVAHSRATSVRRGNSPNVFVNGTHKTDFMSLWIRPCFVLPVCMWSRLSLLKQLDDSVPALLFTLVCLRSSCTGCWGGLCSQRTDLRSDASCAHRYRLLFLALLRQILDAVDEELVGADVGPAGFYHPTAELHQLAEDAEIIIIKVQQKKSILFTELSHNTQLLIESHEKLNKASKDLEFWIIPTSGSESQLFKAIRLLSKRKAEQL